METGSDIGGRHAPRGGAAGVGRIAEKGGPLAGKRETKQSGRSDRDPAPALSGGGQTRIPRADQVIAMIRGTLNG
jgi:hypothetical protein